MSVAVFVEGLLIPLPPLPLLIIQLITGTTLTIGMCEAFRNKNYVYIKEIIKDKFL